MRKLLSFGATAALTLVLPGIAVAATYHAPRHVVAAAATDHPQRHPVTAAAATVQRPVAAADTQTVQTIVGHQVLGAISLTATAYGPSVQDNYPYGATDYFGRPLIPGDVAVDPTVIPLGTRLWVTGYSSSMLPAGGFMARAVDEGNAIQGQRIDIFIDASQQTVSNFGIQHVTAYILK